MASAPVTTGLTELEASRRLAAAERPPQAASRSYTSIALANTLTLFNLILAAFFVVILVAGRPADGLFAGIIVANSAIGIVQEARAKRVLDEAALLIAPNARVVRDGAERRVAASRLVEGDLVALGAGDQILADGTVVESAGLSVDESLLTGESEPEPRSEGDRVLAGSYCVEGAGRMVVTTVGGGSYAGRLVGHARTFSLQRSPLERDINRLLRATVAVMVPLGAAFVWVLVHDHTGFSSAAATATAGIVTLVPEGLVLLTSLTFAVAAVRLARRGMLVQYLNAVESLANVDTVCIDKTGTITDGSLQLDRVIPLGDLDEAACRELLGRYGASARSRSQTLDGIAASVPAEPAAVEREIPFSSRWKWSAVQIAGEDGWLVLGAPEVLLDTVAEAVSAEQAQGLRVLVLARAVDVPDPAEQPEPPAAAPLAAVVLREQLRPEASRTVEFLRSQDVAVKVMSGDAAPTVAAAVAQAGIPIEGPVVEGRDLPADPGQLAAVAAESSVFARLSPDDKRRLVEALAGAGRYVAMIGDGVNDVPAMKSARLSVAFGSGSQLTKGVADCVLVSDSFATIPAAVGQGRQIIWNMRRVAKLFVAKSVFAAAVILTFGLVAAGFPLLPRHLTLAATFTVGVPGFVLALTPATGRPPRISFLREVARFSLPAGAGLAASVLLAYGLSRAFSGPVGEARTAATTAFVLIGLYLIVVLSADRIAASRWYEALVVGLVAVLATGYIAVLAVPALRSFFALQTGGAGQVVVVALSCAVVAAGLTVVGLSPMRARPA
jgi:magnesium-transporting ATPase (P-type)